MPLRSSLSKLVEYVKVALVRDLVYNARLLKKIVVNVCPNWLTLSVELYFQIFTEP